MNGETSTRTSWQSFTATADPSAAAPRIAALRDLMAGHGLDAVMDKIMGAPRRCRTELERQELLFARYAQLTS